jgi:hypothetical protein
MLGLEDAIRKHPFTAVGLAAIAITTLIPRSKRPTWAKGVKAAAQLCIEAEGEAEGEIVERLAEVACNDLVDALAHPAPEARHAAAHAVVRKYAKRAHRRSARFAQDESHRQRRYARHISALEEKISLRKATAPDEQKRGFELALSALKAPPPPGGAGTDAGGSKARVPRGGAVGATR